MPERIGFVGVGRMGANMARRLKECGCEIAAVYDVNTAAAQSLAQELGCEAADRLQQVTQLSDVVITVVSDDKAMKPADIHETSIFIKKVLTEIYSQKSAVTVPILYGGSVSHKNAGDIIALGGVQGLLVGRESLNPKKFGELLKTVD